MRQRAVNFQRFAGDASAFIRAQRAQSTHVVGAVGKLDEDDADVLHHRHDHFAKVFGLRLFLIAELELIKFRHPLYQLGDAFTKKLFHVLVGGGSIFNHIMQQRGHQRFVVELHLGQNTGYRDRVRDIRFTA